MFNSFSEVEEKFEYGRKYSKDFISATQKDVYPIDDDWVLVRPKMEKDIQELESFVWLDILIENDELEGLRFDNPDDPSDAIYLVERLTILDKNDSNAVVVQAVNDFYKFGFSHFETQVLPRLFREFPDLERMVLELMRRTNTKIENQFFDCQFKNIGRRCDHRIVFFDLFV